MLKHIGTVAYPLALPPNLSDVHPVFLVSKLKRYVLDPSHVIQYDEIQLKNGLIYEE